MDNYIIVKVSNERPSRSNGFLSPIGRIRRAIHRVSEDFGYDIADLVTHSRLYMTREESDEVARIFESAMGRARAAVALHKNRNK